MDSAEGVREDQLLEAFVGLADTLVDDYDIIDLLDRLAAYCVGLLSAQAAGIMLVDPQGRLRVAASSDEEADTIELLQLQADQGPCVECVHRAAPVSVPDLTEAGQRWPRFVATLQEGSYRSVHALPLRLRGQAVGGLNLFHHEPGPLPGSDLALGQALADVATISILQERALRRSEVLAEQLQTALNSRVIIEQAKGVLAERANLPMSGAFDRLRRHARRHRQPLTDVARRIVDGDEDILTALTTQGAPADRA